MTRAYIAEYGGLGANIDNVFAYGTGCIYDSQGNLYVIGSVSAYGASQPGFAGSDFADSVMLKYSPSGQLLFHKTWWDDNNMNCGATNVAVSIDNQDRIAWVANSWSQSGCWYGWMDTDGIFGLGGIAQTAAGINQTSPTDISMDNNGLAVMSTSWEYTNPDPVGHIGDIQYIPAVISIPNIIASGTPGFTTGLVGYNTDGSLGHGVFNAVVVTTFGSIAIGNFTKDNIQKSLLVGFDTNGSVMASGTWQYTLDTNTDANGQITGTYGESLAIHDGHLYTVINDNLTGNAYLDKFEIAPEGIGNIWRTTIQPGVGLSPKGYDINFDSVGHVILTGILSTGTANGSSQGYLTIAKFHHDTGALLFVNAFLLGGDNNSGGGENIVDGTSDPLVGHRVASVYQDRIAVSCMTIDDLIDTSRTYDPRILIAQVPTDGSVATPAGPGPSPTSPAYLNLTDLYSSSTSVGTFTPANTTLEPVDLSGDLLHNFNTFTSETNATDVLNFSSTDVTLGTFGSGGIRLKPGMKLRSGVRIVASRGGLDIDKGLLTEDDFVLVTEDNIFALEQEFANSQAVLYGDYVLLTDNDLVITDDNDEAIVQDSGPSLTVASADFTSAIVAGGPMGNGGGQTFGIDGTLGYQQNTTNRNLGDPIYSLIGPTMPMSGRLTTFWSAAGLDLNNAYVFNATFATATVPPGGTTTSSYSCLVRVTWTDRVNMIVIDQTDTSWQAGSGGYVGTSLVGKFMLPVTLTPYIPTTQLGTANDWC
jgi:hypothetical protein